MENKVFELLEKLYVEMQNGFTKVNDRIEKVETEVKQNSKDIQKMQLTIENEIKPDLKMCISEIASIKEKQQEHDARFDAIEQKIESQDVEIKVLKRVK